MGLAHLALMGEPPLVSAIFKLYSAYSVSGFALSYLPINVLKTFDCSDPFTFQSQAKSGHCLGKIGSELQSNPKSYADSFTILESP